MVTNRGRRGNRQQRREKPKQQNDFIAVIERIIEIGIKIFGFLISLIEKFTGRWSALPLGILVVYMVLVNVESYHLALTGDLPFLPKLFTEDGATFSSLATVFTRPLFWLSFVMGIVSGAVQARWWRDRSVELQKAKREYDEVKHHKTDDTPDNAIDLVNHRRKRYKRAGMKSARVLGFGFMFFMAIDVLAALKSYPLMGDAMLINLCWAILSIAGSEIAIALFQDAMEELRSKPKVEVVN